MPTPVTTYHLEMHDPAELRPKPCPNPEFVVRECVVKQYQYNRFLYDLVGAPWQWVDKHSWRDTDWRLYAESDTLRTFVGYLGGSPGGYYELARYPSGRIQIEYFGLAPAFIGQGFGGYLLSTAVAHAWEWGTAVVSVHTCTLDHPHALQNYLARGFRLVRTTVTPEA